MGLRRLLAVTSMVGLADCSPGPSGPEPPTVPPAFTGTALDAIPRGREYRDTLHASGGDGTYVFAVATGALPSGLSLSHDGEIHGIAETLGVFQVGISVTSGGQTATANLRLIVRDFNPIAASWSSTCALRSSWRAYCWGENISGAIGSGTTQGTLTPVPVAGARTYWQLTAGDEHVCGLTPDGEVYCWGYGYLTPVLIPLLRNALQVAAGKSHTCALVETFETYCWGDNSQLQLGRLGSGSNSPSLVQGGHLFQLITTGRQHSCGVTATGMVYCWGGDDAGQLGDGVADAGRSAPAPITLSESFASLDGGWNVTCGVSTSGGWCWGENYLGQLGNGSQAPTANPAPVTGSSSFVRLVTNAARTCALEDDGAAWCWGYNGYEQLGVGTAANPVLSATLLVGGHHFMALELGYYHTCGVEADWDVYCWGANGSGELGDGTQVGKVVPTLVTFP